MRLTGFRGYDWEPAGYFCAIPAGYVPTMTVQPNVIQRAGTTATFGPGSALEMAIPVEFGYRGGTPWENAMRTLLSQLQPYNPDPAELRGVWNDGTAVRVLAVLTFPQGVSGEINTMPATFVALELWEGRGTVAAAGTFAGQQGTLGF